MRENEPMTDDERRAIWRAKAKKRYQAIKNDPEKYEQYIARMRRNARRRKGTHPDNYRKDRDTPRRNRKTETRLLVRNLKIAAGSCHDCGLEITEHNFYKFDFDHRNPFEKRFNLSSPSTYSDDTIHQEAAKCDVVCRNCHADRTHGHQAQAIRSKQSQRRTQRRP